MTMVQAIQDALRVALREDPRVVVLGEDVGRNGGVFRVTEGLQAEFGAERVVDTPLAENGIVGAAIGMALYGLRPVAEIQFVDFIYPAFDQIVSELAKMRWRSAGQYACPVIVRAPYGGGIRGGLYHSQSPEAYFCHTAGLTVVIPSTPSDAKGLLLAALEGEDPVIFLEPKRLYRTIKEEVPEGRYTRAARQGAHRARGRARHGARLRRDGAGRARGRASRPRRAAGRSRSWTCARWCRSTPRRCSRACARPAAS